MMDKLGGVGPTDCPVAVLKQGEKKRHRKKERRKKKEERRKRRKKERKKEEERKKKEGRRKKKEERRKKEKRNPRRNAAEDEFFFSFSVSTGLARSCFVHIAGRLRGNHLLLSFSKYQLTLASFVCGRRNEHDDKTRWLTINISQTQGRGPRKEIELVQRKNA